MELVFLLLLLVYIIISSAWSYREILKYKNKTLDEKDKIKIYQLSIKEGWLVVILVLFASTFLGITIKDIGIRTLGINIFHLSLGIKLATFIICGAHLLLLIYQMVSYQVSEVYRIQLSKQLAKLEEKSSHYDAILTKILFPKTKTEKRWFTAVSATAGIGEEIVYRGFLLYLLMNLFPEWPIYVVLLAAGIFFGIAHSYQGFMGVIKTGLLGIVFGALYIASGSLLPGIILHFMIDFSSNFMYPSKTYDTAA